MFFSLCNSAAETRHCSDTHPVSRLFFRSEQDDCHSDRGQELSLSHSSAYSGIHFQNIRCLHQLQYIQVSFSE